MDCLREAFEIEGCFFFKGLFDKTGQINRPQTTTPVGRQRLLGAGIGRLDRLAVVQVVVPVHAVEEQDAGLGVAVGRAHDLVPQVARAHRAVDPQAVWPLSGFRFAPGLRLVDQVNGQVLLDGGHEFVGDADRDVEVGEVALVLGVDEILDVGVVAAQHAHLRAAARAGRFDGFTGAVEDAHVRHRPAGARLRALHLGALGPDRGEIVAHAAAAAHGLRGLREGRIDAGLAVHDLRNRVAHRLHEAVDQGRLQRDAGRRIDAPGRNEAVRQRLGEALFPLRPVALDFDLRQRARHAAAHLFDRCFTALGVLLDQRLAADLLVGQVGGRFVKGEGLICHCF